MASQKELVDIHTKLVGAHNIIMEARCLVKEAHKKNKTKTKEELIDELVKDEDSGVRAADIALPQDWVEDFTKFTNIYPAPYFCWAYYEDGKDGPHPLTGEASLLLGVYEHIKRNVLG